MTSPPQDPAAARREVAERQVRALYPPEDAASRRRVSYERLMSRRQLHPDLTQCVLAPEGRRPLLTVPGELLVDARTMTPAAAVTIAEAGYGVSAVQRLGGLVLRLREQGCGRRDRSDLLADLLGMDVDASESHVVPCKIVMKSESTPEAIDRSLPERPARGPARSRARVRVALFDTGISARDRRDGWLVGLDRPATRDPLDVLPRPNGYLDLAAGHGTFNAGIVAQLAPDADTSIHRVLDTDGVAGELDVACAMVQAVDDDLDADGRLVLNLSLGTETGVQSPPIGLRVALDLIAELAATRGGEVLVVAAAGNEGTEDPCWPAAFGSVVAVAGLCLDETPAPWSNHGDWVTCSALAEAVVSTYVQGEEDPALDRGGASSFGPDPWAQWTGTSFAAPQVAAAIAQRAHESDGSLRDALAGLLADRETHHPGYGAALSLLR